MSLHSLHDNRDGVVIHLSFAALLAPQEYITCSLKCSTKATLHRLAFNWYSQRLTTAQCYFCYQSSALFFVSQILIVCRAKHFVWLLRCGKPFVQQPFYNKSMNVDQWCHDILFNQHRIGNRILSHFNYIQNESIWMVRVLSYIIYFGANPVRLVIQTSNLYYRYYSTFDWNPFTFIN